MKVFKIILPFIISLFITKSINAQLEIDYQLMEACADSNYTEAEALIKSGANVNFKDADGVTPLMLAVDLNYIELAMLLLDFKADVNALPYNDRSPLLTAARMNYFEMVELLIRRGANIDQQDYIGYSALHFAARYGYLEIAKLLIYYDIQVDLQDNYGNTAMHTAARYGDQELIYELLIAGADINKLNQRNESPLIVSISFEQAECAKYLLENGASSSVKSVNGQNLFQFAVIQENYDLAENLLSYGFDINQKVEDRLSLYNYAKSQQNKEMRKFLLNHGAKKYSGLYFDHYTLHWINNFNLNDYFMGGEVGLHEVFTNIDLLAGFTTRLNRQFVFIGEQPIYQYWEKRYAIHAGINKKITLQRNTSSSFGVYLEAKELYSWGFWDGSIHNPDPDFYFVPGTGIYIDGKYIHASFGVEHYTLPDQWVNPYHITFKIGAFLPTYKVKIAKTFDAEWYL